MPPLKTSALTILLMCTALGSTGSVAQYKWIDQDGRVNYGDRPPANPAQVLPAPTISPRVAPDSAGPALPAALQMVVTRSPVLLFTTPGGECVPCTTARAHLVRRGIPFGEKTLATEADVAAFRQLGARETTVPAMSVGREWLVGYDMQAWDRLLDTSGYPRTSMLPAGYPRTAPEPLAANRPGAEAASPGTATGGVSGSAAAPEPYFKPARPPRPVPTPAAQTPPQAPSTIRF